MRISDKGISIIKHFEGVKLETYTDIVGVKTIGYGHTGYAAFEGNRISEEFAECLLREDISRFEKCISEGCEVNLWQQEFDALVSWAFNVGCGAWRSSTLRELLNDYMYYPASDELLRWCKDGQGNTISGLLRRRKCERHLFRTGEVNYYWEA